MSKKYYRSRNEIVKSILERCIEPRKKTDIMYSVRLSYTQLLDYIGLVVREELIVFEKQTLTFKTTPKGKRYLDALINLDKQGVQIKAQ